MNGFKKLREALQSHREKQKAPEAVGTGEGCFVEKSWLPAAGNVTARVWSPPQWLLSSQIDGE